MAGKNTSRAWQSLPECVALALARLDAPEVHRLRLVCKDWRRAVSLAFTGKLEPKKLAPAAAAFPHATSLSCRSVRTAELKGLLLHWPPRAAEQLGT